MPPRLRLGASEPVLALQTESLPIKEKVSISPAAGKHVKVEREKHGTDR